VPFALIVGDTQLPAGEYEVEEATDEPGILRIQSADGQSSAFAVTINAESPNDSTPKAELTFEKVGDEYFLSRVVMAGAEREIPLTLKQMERELVTIAESAGK